ncbi:hypothetical protein SAMN05444161_0013 [Rhizobiales bacterium GAS191]|nr:hypothetical protein SAMN05444161_0013 [Rhizobiales bacterium GAS191]
MTRTWVATIGDGITGIDRETLVAMSRQAEARQYLREEIVKVDRTWLGELIETLAGHLNAEKMIALRSGDQHRVTHLDDEIDALFHGLQKALKRGRL